MGCDIHMRIEVRDTPTAPWRIVLPPIKQHEYERAPRYRGWYDNRNYYVFAVLAGVRNSEDIIPIDEPRGLPQGVVDILYSANPDNRDDYYGDNYLDPAGDSTVSWCADGWLGDHSHTWFYANELLSAPHWYTGRLDIDNPAVARLVYRLAGVAPHPECVDFVEWMNAELLPLAQQYGGDNVRVLMGFDS